MMTILLATESPYKKALLERLGIQFKTCKPDVDETRLEGELPVDFVERLALSKAQKGAALCSDADLIISGDQVAVHGPKFLGKPGNRENAIAQLNEFSGKQVLFYTSVGLLKAATDEFDVAVDIQTVEFRQLSYEEICRYVDAEKPFNCAGSFKSEGLGVTLFSSIKSEDPTGLIGLPLIKACNLLRSAGIELP